MREIKTILTKEQVNKYMEEMSKLGLTIKPSLISECPDMRKGDIRTAIQDTTLYVADLDRTMFEDKGILNLFFRVNEPGNSHDLECFYFPEETFKDFYTALYNEMKWRVISTKNMNYETASSYTKMKVREQFVKKCFMEAGILNEHAEISFKGYSWNPDMYQFKYHMDNLEYVEYDKFREQGGGLYDLGTAELELMKPTIFPEFKELDYLRRFVLTALRSRILMITDLVGATFLLKEIASQETIYKYQVEAVKGQLKKFFDIMADKETWDWIQAGNNDYTLYVKKNKECKKDSNKEYLRRQTELAYIEAYHNALGALFGYEIFDKNYYRKLIKEDNKYGVFGSNKLCDAENMLEYIESLKEEFYNLEGKALANHIFAPSKSEDATVSYMENLDWKAEEKDESALWQVTAIEYKEPEDWDTNSLAVDAEF